MRRVHANRLNGVDAEWLTPEGVAAFCPLVDVSPSLRYPVLGATLQRRGGPLGTTRWRGRTRRERASSAWTSSSTRRSPASSAGRAVGSACRPRGARSARRGRARGRGPHERARIDGRAAASAAVASLQALVSALYEPVLDCVVMSNKVHVYVSQADKGELVMGAGIDAYNGYAQRGSFHVIEQQLAAAVELSDLRARQAAADVGRIVDVCPDASPIVGLSGIDGLFINCGWGTGGFKATPGAGWAYADDRDGRGHPISCGPSRWNGSRPGR